PFSSTSLRALFVTDTPTLAAHPLSLHDALPIWPRSTAEGGSASPAASAGGSAGSTGAAADAGSPAMPPLSGSPAPLPPPSGAPVDRQSTRLNSSHVSISYAVPCSKQRKQRDVSS